MDVLITLDTIGADHTGLFDVYTNADNFTTAIDYDIPGIDLLGGYTVVNIPVGTTIIRVSNKGIRCNNSIDIRISQPPVTTSTTTTI